MKKLLLIMFATALIIGCAKDDAVGSEDYAPKTGRVEQYKPGVEKEIIKTASGLTVEKLDSEYILEGDVLLSNEQYAELNRPESKGAYMTASTYHWPDGIVYFVFPNEQTSSTGDSYDQYTFTQKQVLYDAMNYYHRTTGVEFRHVTWYNSGRRGGSSMIEQSDYIEIIDGDGCWSALGRRGGKQLLCLDPTWADAGNAMHELGHAIGLLHEQCRKDRDQYVNIYTNNIIPSELHNFEKSNIYHDMTTDFDYNSIMIYNSVAFAIDPFKPTITKKDGSFILGQRDYLSPSDLQAIKAIYKKAPCNVVLKVEESGDTGYRRDGSSGSSDGGSTGSGGAYRR